MVESGRQDLSRQILPGDLKRLALRGGAATFAGQGTKFVMGIASTMILARLLTPQDFGLIAMVASVTGFIMVFRDMGLSTATIQREEINHSQVSTLFWINMGVSGVLTLITLASAPAIAWFYKDQRLIAVTAALSVAFLFGGLTAQHQALLRRQMRLSTVAAIDVISAAVSIATAIGCALAGLGYWSLVWMQIAAAATDAAGAWITNPWRPGRFVRRSGVRSMVAFGGYLTGFNVVNFFARNLDNILIGHVYGARTVGLYSKSYSLLVLPISQLVAPMTSVAVPALSQLQSDPERYRRYYLKALELVAFVTFPVVVIMAMLAREVIAVVLGSQWMAGVPIFRVLAIAAFFQPTVSTVGWIYVSLGQTRRMAKWGGIFSVIVVLSFAIGIRWGALGVATSYAICSVLLVYPCFYAGMVESPITPVDACRAIVRPMILSLVMAGGMAAVQSLIPVSKVLVVVPSAIAGGLVAAALAIMIWPAAKQDLRTIIAYGGDIIGSRRAKPAEPPAEE